MRVLLLGPNGNALAESLASQGNEVVSTEAPINGFTTILSRSDFIISYGYRHILREDVLRRFRGRAVNLHISCLPWNRGASPNLWSFLEDTPKGVTIHYMDEGINTGEVIARKETGYLENDTLRTSYERLKNEAEDLFAALWPAIRDGKVRAERQSGTGSFHRLRDQEPYGHLLTKGWDTPVSGFIGAALKEGAWRL